MNNEYTKQAQEFLDKTKTTLEVVKAVPQKSPLWVKGDEKHGINYSVTLKNKNASYTFDFWGSIKDKEMIEMAKEVDRIQSKDSPEYFYVKDFIEKEGGKIRHIPIRIETLKVVEELTTPTAYDILACLSPLTEDNFEDFCSSFGYESDSITALKTFEACKEQDRQLRRLFSMEELELLTNIQ